MANEFGYVPASIRKKAFSVAYATFRVASKIENAPLKDSLERGAVRCIESSFLATPQEYAAFAEMLQSLIRLGANTGWIHPRNAELILYELQSLSIEMGEHGDSGKEMENLGIEEIFKKGREAMQADDRIEEIRKPAPTIRQDNGTENAATAETRQLKEDSHEKAAMRQSAILERMRQSTICRLRDLQELFPEVSERTLRYDVQNLMEQGLVERIGSGGPTTYYQAKRDAVTFAP